MPYYDDDSIYQCDFKKIPEDIMRSKQLERLQTFIQQESHLYDDQVPVQLRNEEETALFQD